MTAAVMFAPTQSHYNPDMRMSMMFVLLVFPLSSSGRDARAGGHLVGDNGTQAAQRGGAFAAKTDDASALWLNPAGIAGLGGTQVVASLSVVTMAQRYWRAGADRPVVEHAGAPQPIPFFVVATTRGPLGFAAGIVAPHGYSARDFPTALSDGTPAPQRYDVVRQQGWLVLPSVAIAWRATDRLRIGARVSAGAARVESVNVSQGVANADEDPGYDVRTSLQATDWFIPAMGVGVHIAATDALELGASWSSGMTIDARGTAQAEFGPTLATPSPGQENYLEPVPDAQARCASGGTRAALSACVNVSLPQTASAGIRWIARGPTGDERGDIELDVRWEHWRTASDSTLVLDAQDHQLGTPIQDARVEHALQDVLSIRVGGARTVSAGTHRIEVRGGVGVETGAAPASWTRLDFDGAPRVLAGAGFAVDVSPRTRLSLGLSGAYAVTRTVVDQPAPLRAQPSIPVPLAGADAPYQPFNAGSYQTAYLAVSMGTTIAF